MRKVLIVFCLAWVTYSLVITGHMVIQLGWKDRLQLSPSGVQERASGIFNQGAVKASKLAGVARPEFAILFVEDKEGLLKALPLTYWLYPTGMAPASSDYYAPDGTVTPNVDKSLAQTVTRPEAKVIYFIGKDTTLSSNAKTLENYTQQTVAQEGDQVFVVLERKS